MKKALYDYWNFLKKPRLLKVDKNRESLIPDFSTLLILDFLFAGFVVSFHSVLIHYKLVKEYEEFDFFKEFGFWGSLLLAGIAAPLIEECIFRWQLRKRLLSIYFVATSSALLFASFTKNDYIKFFICISSLVFAILIHVLVSKIKKRKAIIMWKRYYVFLFYFTAIIFGYIHYTNIKGLTPGDPSVVFYVISQMFAGLSLGYLCVKYGLRYSMLFHACFNLIAIVLAWFLK